MGDTVPMIPPTRERKVMGLAPVGIDAALLASSVPRKARPLIVQPYVAQWMPVKIHRRDGPQSTIVTA